MRILAIDPGSQKSAVVVFDGEKPLMYRLDLNLATMNFVESGRVLGVEFGSIVCETIDCMGQLAGKDTFATAEMVGKLELLAEQSGKSFHRITRNQVKINICGKTNSTDTNIRQALIDRFGGQIMAIGGVRCFECKGKGWRGRGRPTCEECSGSGYEYKPGPLHGIATHVWSALAVAVTYFEKQKATKP